MVELKLCDYGNPPGLTNSFCNDPNALAGDDPHSHKLDSDEPYPPSPSATLQKNITLVVPEKIQHITVKGFAQLSVQTIPDIDVLNNDKPVSGLKISRAGQKSY